MTAPAAARPAAPTRPGGLLARFDELLGRRVSLRSLRLLRIAVGPVVLLHLRPFLADAWRGTIYRDVFHEPYAGWYPEAPRLVHTGLLGLAVAAALGMTAGWRTRAATATTFGVVAHNLFLSTTHFHNNRAYLVIVLAGLAAAPCGRKLSVDAWLRRRRELPPLDPRAPAWPLWLLRFEASTVYGASGLSKLLDADWFGGTVTWLRMVQVEDRLSASVLPDWAVALLVDRSFHTGAAKAIMLTELFIAFGLWSRSTRYAAVWVAVGFHVAIQLTARVEVFSMLAIAALVIWAVPSTRDRVIVVDARRADLRRLMAVVGALDGLARFRVVPARAGTQLVVVDRDQRVVGGRAAVAFVPSRLPLTAWFALPVSGCIGRGAARTGRAG